MSQVSPAFKESEVMVAGGKGFDFRLCVLCHMCLKFLPYVSLLSFSFSVVFSLAQALRVKHCGYAFFENLA